LLGDGIRGSLRAKIRLNGVTGLDRITWVAFYAPLRVTDLPDQVYLVVTLTPCAIGSGGRTCRRLH
jgi:hypothetical protein